MCEKIVFSYCDQLSSGMCSLAQLSALTLQPGENILAGTSVGIKCPLHHSIM